jgi:hypothetical protein
MARPVADTATIVTELFNHNQALFGEAIFVQNANSCAGTRIEVDDVAARTPARVVA